MAPRALAPLRAAEPQLVVADVAEAGRFHRERHADQAWGAGDFVVRDPDGTLVRFAGPAT